MVSTELQHDRKVFFRVERMTIDAIHKEKHDELG